MRAIQPRLYLGNALDARDLRRIFELEIAVVIDLALEEPPAQLGREIAYCRFPLADGAGNQPWLLRAAIQTTARFIETPVTTLVACSGGMSRSPSVIAAALSRVQSRDAAECLLEIVRDQPHDVSPLLWADIQNVLRAWK